MDLQEFKRLVGEGRRRVQLPVAEDGGLAERGFLADPEWCLRDQSTGANKDDPMMMVVVDREFVAPRFDDGHRELSVSQIVEFLPDVDVGDLPEVGWDPFAEVKS